ncbi:MAG: 6-phosphofructokinase [Ignavibacteria bacterium RIFOXYB2_FULL_35_12]|nr:MAG: 6-phosphofructokinase [Ignavibacteria bacterium GWC2_35_8]OGU58914.1 MAG: 6-phosphofructokinase [Ignavibacteria bacterium GWF2_35_20]OGU78790.1 MAG: 6-phosphofructokinase [Ignavibacteria bacterium RIFOXYA2_FULL_35_9]OGU90335.1 MAG: 6-phosphofructokinase [Ignavibacteria bacterium RIFOXYA12_FULL_35_25]OGU96001.1 MAG: 6-phosphofructokinase [Ignavibacteria bacterium RIFOXYB12_FULL_35_14]OGU99364.1 MAG: 6-phosphofructokinase [Ignavibacteria bacterium RIFOXYC2_FULL_35_16]OGV02732.1 MAG: 6-p
MASSKKINRIGIITGGGDCPGLNAVIRGVTKPAQDYGMNVFGILDGFEGLVEGKAKELNNQDVSGILAVGGTILGSSNKGDPFHWPIEINGKIEIVDKSQGALKNYQAWGLDAIIAIGGDGTMHICNKLSKMGMNVIGVPKTIDNDLEATDMTFGHDSAVYVVSMALDRLHTTASSHHRVMVVEVMGRYAGWIALNGGLSGGADIILIPEIPFSWDKIYKKIHERQLMGKRFSLICVAEGAKPVDGEMVIKGTDRKRTDPVRLGGIAELVAANIEKHTKRETRVTVLGHLQRGGSPTPFDRILATKFGAFAIELAAEKKFGRMVALKGSEVKNVKIEDAISRQKLVQANNQAVRTARAIGISFGE